uniref:Uncharacterized protein n=1 Tax=Triticum urartu TaxID=4572 RepID=A0A8R7TF61_TRIUA
MPPLLTLSSSPAPPPPAPRRARFRVAASADVGATAPAAGNDFPSFLPRAVERIRDGAALRLAKRIERVPVQTGFSKSPIPSSCVRPLKQQQSADPVVLLHGFDRCVQCNTKFCGAAHLTIRPAVSNSGVNGGAATRVVFYFYHAFSSMDTLKVLDAVLV